MSQIGDNDDNHSIAASDFDQLSQPGDFVDPQKHQQQLGYQNPLDWTMNNGSPNIYGHYLKEMNLKISALEAKNQTLQSELEKVELKAENRALKEKANQMADYQAVKGKMSELKDEFAKMLSEQQKHIAQLEAKNHELEKKLSTFELAKGTTIEKMAELELKLTSLEETQQKEIAIMQIKIQETETKAQVQINRLKQTILANRQQLDDIGKEMATPQQNKEPNNASKKRKRFDIDNPLENRLNSSNPEVTISADGYSVKLCPKKYGWLNVFAQKGFAISGDNYRVDQFARNILFYYEVKLTKSTGGTIYVGLSKGSFPDGSNVENSPNSYAMYIYEKWYFLISGMQYEVKLSNSQLKPICKGVGDFYGCGIMLGSTNKVAVFFTLNGILIGKQIPIASPLVDCLYPTVSMKNPYNFDVYKEFEANFVNDRANPFKYDIAECPGLVFH